MDTLEYEASVQFKMLNFLATLVLGENYITDDIHIRYKGKQTFCDVFFDFFFTEYIQNH